MEKTYWIIWQLGNNEQSRETNVVDVMITDGMSGTDKHTAIMKALQEDVGEVDGELVGLNEFNIISVFLI